MIPGLMLRKKRKLKYGHSYFRGGELMVVQTVETITKEILDSYVDQAARAAGYEKGVRRAGLRLIASGMVGGILPTVSGPADAEQPAA